MRMYFSTVHLKYGLREALIEMNVKNMLFSYWYNQNFKEWLQLVKTLNRPNVIIDSGAFSAWTSGREVNRKEYLDFIYHVRAEFAPFCNEITYINLDKIPAEFGRKPTANEIEDSAKFGLENYRWFQSQGVETMHIFHQHERWEWLQEIMKLAPYIGISPANDLTTQQRLPWLRKCFQYVGTKNRTHCFGGTSKDLLFAVPFFSADSSSYQRALQFGVDFGKMVLSERIMQKDKFYIIKKKIKDEIRIKQTVEQEATLLWKHRGVTF